MGGKLRQKQTDLAKRAAVRKASPSPWDDLSEQMFEDENAIGLGQLENAVKSLEPLGCGLF